MNEIQKENEAAAVSVALHEREKSLMQKLAGATEIFCIPKWNGLRIIDIPEDEILEELTAADLKTGHSEDYKTFYSNACFWLGRLNKLSCSI